MPETPPWEEHCPELVGLACLGQLGADLAHRVNTSLSVVAVAADRLRRANLDDAGQHRLDAICSATEQAAATLRHLQALTETPEAPPGPVDVARLVHHLAGALGELFPRAVTLSFEVASMLPRARGDAGEVRSLLLALLLAARAEVGTSGVIRVRAETLAPDRPGQTGGDVQVRAVAGPGPTRTPRPAADPDARAGQRRSGTWLAVAERLAPRRGGRLEVCRTENGSTELRLILPGAEV